MTVLVDEVGRVECGESGDGEMGDGGEGGGEMGAESEACQLALDITQQLLVSNHTCMCTCIQCTYM